MRVDLRADRAELAGRALQLGHGGIGIDHRHAGAETGDPAPVGPDELGQALVADRAICREISGEPRPPTGGAQMLMSCR